MSEGNLGDEFKTSIENFGEEVVGQSNGAVTQWSDKGKRFVAFFIDIVIASVLSAVAGKIGVLLAASYLLLRDGLNFSFMDQRSLGKKLMKLRIHSTDGSPLDLKSSAKRNWPFALSYIPALLAGSFGFLGFVGFVLLIVEGVKVIMGDQRIGDGMANTIVYEAGS